MLSSYEGKCGKTSKRIRVAILGCGGVGQCIAQDLAKSDLVSELVLADLSKEKTEQVRKRVGSDKIEGVKADASNTKEISKITSTVDVLVNAVAPKFNLKIMEACLQGGSNYIDMASSFEYLGIPSLYKSFDQQPEFASYENPQFRQCDKWEAAGQLALLGMGVEPGLSDILAKRAADQMDSIEYVKIRDGDNSVLKGHEFATYFSPEAMLEEVLVDPIYWDNGKWHRSPALEVSEMYDFPPPVGCLKVYRTDHEENELIPQFLGKPVRKVDFMIGLEDKFVDYIKMLKKLGLTQREQVDVKGAKVSPLDLVIATMPCPDTLGDKIMGTSCCLVEVGGIMKGKNTVIRTWINVSHEESYRRTGQSAVSYQTAMPVAVAVEMFARGEISVRGVRSPEETIDPVKFCKYLATKHIPIYEEITSPDETRAGTKCVAK